LQVPSGCYLRSSAVIDPQRARQLTEQLLRRFAPTAPRSSSIDITGVAAMDVTVANHLVQTVEASRPARRNGDRHGPVPEIAQTSLQSRGSGAR